ncbi:MAG: ABC transporter permease [Deltaproteobacteria bacterium]
MPIILATDFIVYLLFLATLFFVSFAIKRQGKAFIVWRRIKTNRLAALSTIALVLYGLIAFCDSVRWRDAITDEKGAIQKTESGETIWNPEPLSILDRVFTKTREGAEKTFSSPLANTLYVKEIIELPDGSTTRDYPSLKRPGAHLLGTDKVGGDVFFAAMKGVRTGIVIGAGTTVVMIPFAILFGVLAGYYGRWIDDIIQYTYTTLSSIPGVLLIVAFMLIFGTEGYQGGLVTDKDLFISIFVFNERLFWLCVIMGITSWTDLCRLIRGETLKLRELEYVQAGRAFGSGGLAIIWRHIVPNVTHLVLITMVLQFSGLVLAEAILSYIGIGVGTETGSWGNMINNARLELSREPSVWWSLAGAFVFMFCLVLPANIFADAVRDALDPKLRGK